jgi:hypothetical protein
MRKTRSMRGRRGNGREGEKEVKVGVVRKGMRREEVNPMQRRVTRSPRQEAIGGAMLSVMRGRSSGYVWWMRKEEDVPGSRLKWRQRRTRQHIKEPRMIPERQAEAMDVDATITNLKRRGCVIRYVRTRR